MNDHGHLSEENSVGLRALEDKIIDGWRAVYGNDMDEESCNILATRSGH